MKLMPEEHASCVEDFVSQYQRVAGQLRALIYRASCPQLIKHNQVRCSALTNHLLLATNNIASLSHTPTL